MNILLISQCRKNALKETRRILDQFAERCGERTWQTPITQAGLQTLHRLLRATARKNTAVACYWTHGKNHTELLWIVGDRRQFNTRGRVPTNRTRRDILRGSDENGWQQAVSIQIVAVIAALLHDLGKATLAFQGKLHKGENSGEPYRHEWLSLRLFEAMIADCTEDQAWLQRLQHWETYRAAQPDWHRNIKHGGKRADCDFSTWPPLARWVGWLIVSHHRMPFHADMNYRDSRERRILQTPGNAYLQSSIADFFRALQPAADWVHHPHIADHDRYWHLQADPTASTLWQKAMSRWAGKALRHAPLTEAEGGNPLLWHLSRLALMAGDHHYSALPADDGGRVQGESPLAANTAQGVIKQRLDEHLLGVAKETARFARWLPMLAPSLPALRHKAFCKNTTDKRFQWQNKAAQLMENVREAAASCGFFGINLASTGCGKTLANARMMYALAGPEQGARITIALGLRVLTLQTGQALRERLQLVDHEHIVTLVGNQAVRDLHALSVTEGEAALAGESAQALLDDNEILDQPLLSANIVDDSLFATILRDRKAAQLLDTPLVSCTIDHLVAVSEQLRGGRYIVPMLRLLTSDLILDEPDDFAREDLPALARLVYWAGMLGSRVLLSSATLTPDMVQGLYEAYQRGRHLYNAERGLPQENAVCAWFDEFHQQSGQYDALPDFAAAHAVFCVRRIARLREAPVRRQADWLEVNSADPATFSAALLRGATHLHHQHQQTDPASGKTASVGLIRFANINAMMKQLLAFLRQQPDADTAVHVACYHGNQLLLLRSLLEEKLDRILNRKKPEALFEQPEIRAALAQDTAQHHIFIVFGTAVTEVGRDHDYDWAIVEPSSLRSIIQLAGRIGRHRPGRIAETPNILLLTRNLKALQGQDPAYCRPGFESDTHLLADHDLRTLLDEETRRHVNAIPRLHASYPAGDYAESLAELEHSVMRDLLNRAGCLSDAYTTPGFAALLSAHHARISPFRAGEAEESYTAQWDESEGKIIFKTSANAWRYPDDYQASKENGFELATLPDNPAITPWLATSFRAALDAVDSENPQAAALRYATVNLRRNREAALWHYHDWGGFWQDS